jgi:hypothetical protein
MRLNRRLRMGAGFLVLCGAFATALWLPIPTVPDAAQAQVIGSVAERLPGWRVERVRSSWEGAYTVVASCAGRQLGFQFIPGHGLPASDAWLQPSDAFARQRLTRVSDHHRYLIWFDNRPVFPRLSCNDELGPRATAGRGQLD